jgi:hypothetical protein
MDSNRILLIGRTAPLFRNGDFWNPPNLAEFNATIWYPKSLSAEERDGHGASIVARFKDLAEWVKEGHILAIIGAPIEGYRVYRKQTAQHL